MAYKKQRAPEVRMKKDISAAGSFSESALADCLSFAGKATRSSAQAYRKRKARALTSTSCLHLALGFPFGAIRQTAKALKPVPLRSFAIGGVRRRNNAY